MLSRKGWCLSVGNVGSEVTNAGWSYGAKVRFLCPKQVRVIVRWFVSELLVQDVAMRWLLGSECLKHWWVPM